MVQHKRQHFIPRSYLAAWCDPTTPKGQTPYLWTFSKDGKEVRKRAPENVFVETDMYTIQRPGGGRDLTLEHGLQELESRFCQVRDGTLRQQRPLTDEDRLILCYFMAAMKSRTRGFREFQRSQWRRPLEMMNRMAEWAKTASPEERRLHSSISTLHGGAHSGLSREMVEQIVNEPTQTLLPTMITTSAPLLYQLDMAILDAKCAPGFITSDSPCVWFDPEAYKRPPLFRAPALMYETIEISLPIAPWQMILLNRKGLNGYIGVDRPEFIDEHNRMTRFHAEEHFVVSANLKKDAWFDPGIEPEDSWERTHGRVEKDSEEGKDVDREVAPGTEGTQPTTLE